MEILDEIFNDVFTYDNIFDNDYFIMYFNSEYGIVSFIDDTGKQWKIKTE